MASLLMTSQIRFKVLRRVGKTSMDIVLNSTSATHIKQSICNISEITNRKTQLQFIIFSEGGHRFSSEISLKFKMSYLL